MSKTQGFCTLVFLTLLGVFVYYIVVPYLAEQGIKEKEISIKDKTANNLNTINVNEDNNFALRDKINEQQNLINELEEQLKNVVVSDEKTSLLFSDTQNPPTPLSNCHVFDNNDHKESYIYKINGLQTKLAELNMSETNLQLPPTSYE
ncbi:MAG: hypothetical protein ACQBVK_01515 [Candidatus Phytoplasma sp. TWB_XP]